MRKAPIRRNSLCHIVLARLRGARVSASRTAPRWLSLCGCVCDVVSIFSPSFESCGCFEERQTLGVSCMLC